MENFFVTTGDRFSESLQLMVARRFGNVSLQLSGTLLHTTSSLFPVIRMICLSIGGAVRLPLTKSVFIISDYFHSFRSQESIDAWEDCRAQQLPIHPRDVFGIGVEILTAGHVFHLNFTNARNILENRFLPRTTDHGQKVNFAGASLLTTKFYAIQRLKRTNKSILYINHLDLSKIKLFLNTMLNGELACWGNDS